MNLVTLCGQRVPTLRHMLEHYADLVDDIYLIVHKLGRQDAIEERVRAIADDVGCGIYKTVVAEHFDPVYATALYNETLKQRPDEWWVIADPDEFHLYFDDVRKIIDECELTGCSFVGGHFLDRFGPDGTLPKLDQSDIWRQLPMAGQMRSIVTSAPPWKICLAKGKLNVLPGQHCVSSDENVFGYPVLRGLVQVHHFKWDSTVLDRHRETMSTLKSEIAEISEICLDGYRTMHDYLAANGGKADMTDARGLFAACPEARFLAYPYWSEIVKQVPDHGLVIDWRPKA